MVSDDQILQTQTFFLHKMSQNERIQASTADFIDPVPSCLYLLPIMLVWKYVTLKKVKVFPSQDY